MSTRSKRLIATILPLSLWCCTALAATLSGQPSVSWDRTENGDAPNPEATPALVRGVTYIFGNEVEPTPQRPDPGVCSDNLWKQRQFPPDDVYCRHHVWAWADIGQACPTPPDDLDWAEGRLHAYGDTLSPEAARTGRGLPFDHVLSAGKRTCTTHRVSRGRETSPWAAYAWFDVDTGGRVIATSGPAEPQNAPKVASIQVVGAPFVHDTYRRDETITVLVQFSRAVNVTGAPRLALTIGADTRLATYSGSSTATSEGSYLYFDYVVQASDRDTDGIGVIADAIRLGGGTIRAAGDGTIDALLSHDAVPDDPAHKVDGSIVVAPTIAGVEFALPPSTGDTYELGAVIWLEVEFDGTKPGVAVSGNPRMALTIGSRTRWATYHAGAPSGEHFLYFLYTVQASDRDAGGIRIPANAIRVDGGTIRTASGTDAALDHDAVRSTGDGQILKVDGSAVSPPAVLHVGPLWNVPANDHTYVRGETIRVVALFDKIVAVTGSPRMSLTIGARTREARYAPEASNDIWLSFDHVVQPWERDPDGIGIPANAVILDGGTIKSALGRATDARLTHPAEPDDDDHKVDGGAAFWRVPLFTSADQARQGFARIINRSERAGTVRIEGIDDAGTIYGPVVLSLNALQTRNFSARDLEAGNASKGLDGGLGDGEGSWRLELATDLNVDPAAYIRTRDGFVTSMHEVVRSVGEPGAGDGVRHQVPFFNPASNRNQVSWLRLVNLTNDGVNVTIRGRDDTGRPAPGGEVQLPLPANGARSISARQLESGGTDLEGRLGDGTGKWRLTVTADRAIQAMSLLQTPTGHLANLSTSLDGTISSPFASTRCTIPLFTSPDRARQGFARIINRSDRAGTVRIEGIDDAGTRYGPVDLSLNALQTRNFNARDLEAGNASKGLDGGLGDGEGSWRLELATVLDVEAAAYIRTGDGFVTPMHGVVRTVGEPGAGDGVRHRVPFFNPGSNRNQVSWLRLINLTDDGVNVTIRGRDDAGHPAPGGEVQLTLPANAARSISARQLESGGTDLEGRLGDGTGKWQLFVTADGTVQAMSLLRTPTGHLSNLSTTLMGRDAVCEGVASATVEIPDAGLRAAVEEALGKAAGEPITQAEMATLTRLDASSRGIETLTGLEYAAGLTRLHLGDNQISNLSPLSGLTALQSLVLSHNQIADVTPLSGLTALTELRLWGNVITDFTPLSGLTALSALSLWTHDQVTDLTPLSGLTGLRDLTLSGGEITDLTPLLGLTALAALNLDGTQISDLSPLSGLTALAFLSLSGASITDFTPLSSLTALSALYLGGTQISDLSPLSDLTGLTSLGLMGNRITDLTPLSGLTALSTLYLAGNQVSDLSSLSGLTALSILYLSDNRISDLSPLSELTSLWVLSLHDNQISDIGPLVANAGLGDGDTIILSGNPLSAKSRNRHIPTLQARGVEVSF